MPIKLNTASGGGVILQGANTASDKTITIPADDGTMIYANSSGNVGIGTSSPAVSGSAASTLNVKGTSTNNAALLTVQSNDGGSSVQFWSGNNNTDNPAVVFQKNLRFGTATDGGVGGFTERARLDTNGSLLIGSSSNSANNSKLQVTAPNIGVDNGAGGQAIMVASSTAYGANVGGAIGIGGIAQNGATVMFGSIAGRSEGNGFAGYLQLATLTSGGSLLERARIDSSGNLLVAKTATTLTTRGSYLEAVTGAFISSQPSGGSSAAFFATSTGNQIGGIGHTATTTSYTTSSDYRLKHDIAPMQNALAKVAALKPVTYKWNVDDSHGEGFIAHELAEVVPGCVTGEKDAVDADGNPVYQGIDTSFLVATLTAAIQEQQAMIEELKSKVAALEAK